jgi:hypothetical protein
MHGFTSAPRHRKIRRAADGARACPTTVGGLLHACREAMGAGQDTFPGSCSTPTAVRPVGQAVVWGTWGRLISAGPCGQRDEREARRARSRDERGADRRIAVKHHVFGIHVTQRVENIPSVQATLTKFGCNIRTRIGIHDADNTSCSPSGLILVDAIGAEEQVEEFYRELAALRGVDLQRMDFLEQ